MSWKQIVVLSIIIAALIGVALLDMGPLPSWLLAMDSRQIGHLTPFDQFQAQQSIRVTVLQTIGGFVLISGAVVAWSQVRIANQTLSLSRSTRVTEVFAKAVEQLGAEGLATRLGGLYALDKLAKDNEKERPNIAAILSAFARRIPADPLAETPSDIQVAVTLLASGLYAGDVNLRGARLRGVNLRSAELRSASLEDAVLSSADLTDADLSHASLTGADLRRTRLVGANLRYANLSAADLREAQLDASEIERAITDKSTQMNQT